MAGANLCCSIEMEPRTLKEAQLNRARVVATDVVQKMEPKEASTIFGQGLEPIVAPTKEMAREEDQINERHHDDPIDESKEKADINVERNCQCSHGNDTEISPDKTIKLKEPLSAPF